MQAPTKPRLEQYTKRTTYDRLLLVSTVLQGRKKVDMHRIDATSFYSLKPLVEEVSPKRLAVTPDGRLAEILSSGSKRPESDQQSLINYKRFLKLSRMIVRELSLRAMRASGADGHQRNHFVAAFEAGLLSRPLPFDVREFRQLVSTDGVVSEAQLERFVHSAGIEGGAAFLNAFAGSLQEFGQRLEREYMETHPMRFRPKEYTQEFHVLAHAYYAVHAIFTQMVRSRKELEGAVRLFENQIY